MVLCVHRRQLCWERVLANAGCAWMMLHAVGWGGLRAGLQRVVRLATGRAEGAAVRAGNKIGDDGTASLAPSLARMEQLTSLSLTCTLRASAAAALSAGGCERRLCMNDVVCCALGCSG